LYDRIEGKGYKKFENIKHIREDKSEFWSARELAIALEYSQTGEKYSGY